MMNSKVYPSIADVSWNPGKYEPLRIPDTCLTDVANSIWLRRSSAWFVWMLSASWVVIEGRFHGGATAFEVSIGGVEDA